MKSGRYNIAQLLTSPEIEQIVIPELQRDYVWGERNVKGLLSSILDNYNSMITQKLQIRDFYGNEIENDIMDYLNEEYMRLRYNTRVGFIYAYHDRNLSYQYYLIDGQQRLTTVFLLLLALYRRFDVNQFRKKYFVSSIPKIDYKVREVAHSFVVDFIEYELTKTNENDTFKESSRYYCEYDKDITAQSIYTNYYNVIVPATVSCNNVESLINYVENYIEFNYFDTNISEQGEKLYLYMNSRGESLSTQERIKSVIISRSSDKLLAGRKWEDWQNFFWRTKSKLDKNADRGFFEFIKWAVIIHMCKYKDTKVKETTNKEKSKSRVEEIEDYIRIEKDVSTKVMQADWIFAYILVNENFSFDWLLQVELAVEYLHELLKTPEFQKWDFDINPWFSGCDETIEYMILLGLLYYLISFNDSNNSSINILRMAMYLKNLKSEYTLRRNPDRAVIRSINLIDWMARNEIIDVRLLGKYSIHVKDDLNDKYVLRTDDLRWGYYQLDWQEAQDIHTISDKIGQWESFFWGITNNKELNRFLRGNHDFIIRLLQRVPLNPKKVLTLFIEKIYNCLNDDNLRKGLLKYGDISVYDNGGSNNIGPNWMERWCLLATDRDESYWNEFMNGKESIKIVSSYITGDCVNIIHNSIFEELGNNLKYMNQKYYLWDDRQRIRVIILKDKQASKSKARDLCVQFLHQSISNSWIWENNFCIVNFVSTEGCLYILENNKNKGYYIDFWYDWAADGGRWYCRIGHKEQNLSEELIRSIQEKAAKVLDVECNWKLETTNHISLKTETPIYKEKVTEDYFQGAIFVKSFFDAFWLLLTDLNKEGFLV